MPPLRDPVDRLLRLAGAALPSDVAVLLGMCVASGAACLFAAEFPISDRAPIELARALGALALVLAVVLRVWGARLPRVALDAIVVTKILGAGLLLSRSTTNGGLMMTAWAYPWFAVYVALFFSPTAARRYAVLMTGSAAVGFAIANVPRTFAEWVIVTITVWVATITLSHLSERLRERADTDSLTGLLNRAAFTRAATREHALAARTGNPLTLALVDLDGFKAVNDEHGHAEGDRLLTELAHAWERTVRPGDIIARHGGDEFVVLFPATSAEEGARALARLRDAHTAAWSAGVTEWARGETLADCVVRADRSLYEAKASGGRVSVRTTPPKPASATLGRPS